MIIEKAKLIVSNGAWCPKCNSKSIEGREYDHDTPLTQKVICLECNHEWREVLKVTDYLTAEGEPTFPTIFPVNEIFSWSWVVTCPGCTEYVWHGPFKRDPHTKFWQAARKIWLAMKEDYDGPIHEVQLDPQTGRLVSIELVFSEDESDNKADTT